MIIFKSCVKLLLYNERFTTSHEFQMKIRRCGIIANTITLHGNFQMHFQNSDSYVCNVPI